MMRMNKRSQVLPFMVLIMIVLILAIAASYVIGESGFQKVRIMNVVDSAVISSASQLARALNSVKAVNKGILMNYISTQSAALALAGGPCSKVIPKFFLIIAEGFLKFYQLYKGAEDILEESIKSARQNLYDSCLGGLVDEPTPFLESEVERDEKGRVISIDYAKYLKRIDEEGTTFEKNYLDFKRNDKSWYKAKELTYYFNKSKKKVLEREGMLLKGEAASPNYDYENYVKVNLKRAPTKAHISVQWLIVMTWCCIEVAGKTVCYPIPAPFPAWIRSVDLDTEYVEAEVKKYISFENFSLFPNKAKLKHTARAKIKGNIWTYYDFVLEK